jgi:hypothetical protein
VPTVSGLSPPSGPATGGTSVTVFGSNFSGATAVLFGSTPGTDLNVVSTFQLTVDSPAAAAGTAANVTVTTPGGTSAPSSAVFNYVAAPIVSFLNPTFGPPAGGTAVTITGVGLTGATAVDFGTTAVPFTFVNDTTIMATSPAGNGTVNVTVTTQGGGTSADTAGDQFTYEPSVTGLSPATGDPGGGTAVTITGAGFSTATAVNFGTTTLTNFVIDSPTTITVDSPPGTGTVDVTVTTPTGTSTTSSADQFTYSAGPTVTGVSPISGPSAGGTVVVITGTNLAGVTAVSFGTASVTTLLGDTSTQVTVLSPVAQSVGPVNVTVTTAGGTSAISSADLFYYAAVGAVQPRVNTISPQFGSPSGGTLVTITGLGFDPSSIDTTLVYFGTIPATSYTILTTHKIEVESPPGVVGPVVVSVITQGGISLNSASDVFTYTLNGPQVTGVARYGIHAQPTYLVINFNQTLDPASAVNLSNYLILAPTGQVIKVKSARYNPATNTVTLVTAQRLSLHVTYILSIIGTAPSGLMSNAGVLFDGAYTGEPGSNFVTTITSSDLAGPASAVRKLGVLDLREARAQIIKSSLDLGRTALRKAAVDHLLAPHSVHLLRRRAKR